MKLPPVPQGAGIIIVAPASFARQERVELGIDALRGLGFSPRLAENAHARGPLFFAGTAEQRVADLHAAFADPESQIVDVPARRLWLQLCFTRPGSRTNSQTPKPFFAYSDLTGVQLRLLDELGLPAFHGPMAAADFYLDDGVHLPSFHAALAGEGLQRGRRRRDCACSSRASAKGALYGGCLSILVSLLGTPWEPATEGKLLFLEDTGAKPYQIDRMLWQLRHAGKLKGVSGIIFGEMLDCISPGTPPEFLDQVITSAFDDFEGPIAIGLRSGHVSRQNATLVFGMTAQLELTLHAEPQVKLEWA